VIRPPIEILKSLWSRLPDGRWGVTDLKGLKLKPNLGYGSDYFAFEGVVELMTTTPSRNIHEAFASFGTTHFLMQQSVLPVVAWKEEDPFIRCIGTASVVSCSGYLITAAHVLMDPFDSGYGAIRRGTELCLDEALNFGVFIPISPAYGARGIRFFPFEKFWLWGTWKESPLISEKDRFDYLTDIAICKIAEMPHGAAHQPLGLSLNPFVPGEAAYSLGYAEMDDIPLEKHGNGPAAFNDFAMDLYVSIGEAMQIFPQNHLRKDVSTPGPCFDFKAKIPGKMSGAPIFGANGAVIRGVVSRSFSGERHAFGAMLGPAMHLPLHDPLNDDRTLRTLMESGNEGIARIHGMGL
jgi:hypothetical protein